jgi:hypothetical protein
VLRYIRGTKIYSNIYAKQSLLRFCTVFASLGSGNQNEQAFVARDATTWQYIKENVSGSPFVWSLHLEVFERSKRRNSPYIFSGNCIPTNESLFTKFLCLSLFLYINNLTTIGLIDLHGPKLPNTLHGHGHCYVALKDLLPSIISYFLIKIVAKLGVTLCTHNHPPPPPLLTGGPEGKCEEIEGEWAILSLWLHFLMWQVVPNMISLYWQIWYPYIDSYEFMNIYLYLS